MPQPTPIYTIDLFPILDRNLINLLSQLLPEEWNRPTVCRGWSVKDIAAHLLDGNFRRIALNRDGYQPAEKPDIRSYRALVDYLNGLNADWVKATRRLSPAILIDLLGQTSQQVYDAFRELPPHGRAIFSVGWAGEDVSENWFDIAREYTERWHHQMQIRMAVDQPGELMSHRLYYPVLDTFMRALPHTYRDMDAPEGTAVQVTVTGEGAGNWYVYRQNDRWQLAGAYQLTEPSTVVKLDGAIAWRVFTKGISAEAARMYIQYEGDQRLAEKVVNMLTVMA